MSDSDDPEIIREALLLLCRMVLLDGRGMRLENFSRIYTPLVEEMSVFLAKADISDRQRFAPIRDLAEKMIRAAVEAPAPTRRPAKQQRKTRKR